MYTHISTHIVVLTVSTHYSMYVRIKIIYNDLSKGFIGMVKCEEVVICF